MGKSTSVKPTTSKAKKITSNVKKTSSKAIAKKTTATEKEEKKIYPNFVIPDGDYDVFGGGRVLEPKGEHKATLIFLHHWISRAETYVGKLRYVFDNLDGVRIVLPQAPKRHSKWYGYNTPLWFQYKIGTTGDRPNDAVEATLDECAERLVNVVKAEVKKVGDPKMVWLGGNSMGGPAAFHALMDTKMPTIGGFIASSGTIDACTKPDRAKASMPIYFCTAATEEVYPKSRTAGRLQDFRRAGFTNLENKIYPGRKHGSNIMLKDGLTNFKKKMEDPGASWGARPVPVKTTTKK